MNICSKILYRNTQFHCEHGEPRNTGHAISLLNTYIICIVPDLASITNEDRFECTVLTIDLRHMCILTRYRHFSMFNRINHNTSEILRHNINFEIYDISLI